MEVSLARHYLQRFGDAVLAVAPDATGLATQAAPAAISASRRRKVIR